MIEPEAVTPAAPARRRRRAVLAGATLLAVVAGGVAVAAGSHRAEPAPLALMAGPAAAEKTVAPAASADSRSFAPYPYGGWGLKFQVDGDLPDLPDRATDWRVSGPALDRAGVARIAAALGVTGPLVARDGGWFVDDGDWALAANPAGDTWSISYYRSRFDGTGDAATAGPALSQAEAEHRVQELVDRMGAPGGVWTIEATETEIGVGWACAAPAPAPSPEELKKLEADKLRQQQDPGAGSTGTVAPCPPPPPPVKGFNVAVHPVLDGHRADWAVWTATLRSDGRVENLYGSWATFEGGADYKLRGVDAALKELTSAPQPMPMAADGIAVQPLAVEPASLPAGAPTADSGAGGAAAPAVASPGIAVPTIAPDCPPVAMRLPADKATASAMPACVPPTPQVVTITGVELGLMQAPVFEDGRARLHLVPAYRFLGHFDNGMPWQTSVIALHPDAIAPPPGVPVAGDTGAGAGGSGSSGSGAVGKAVPPTPAPPEAVVAPAPAKAG